MCNGNLNRKKKDSKLQYSYFIKSKEKFCEKNKVKETWKKKESKRDMLKIYNFACNFISKIKLLSSNHKFDTLFHKLRET